jgi:tricorn protease
MTNNRSYSDAEIFPHAFRALGLGKLVGQATGGFVIGTGSTRLIDGSSFRIPRIGVYTNKGVNMEKQGVAPDVAVEITPEQWFRGIDSQLLKAVDVVADDVKAWKKTKTATGTGVNAPNAPNPPTAGKDTPVAPMPRVRPTPTPMEPRAPAPGGVPPAGLIPMAED